MARYVPDPQYEHDVFVSYAHVDDTADPEAEQGWVTVLVQRLRNRLSERLGGADYSLWSDRGMPGNVPVTETILNAVTRSATLVVVLSNGYVRSSWCADERRAFLTAVDARRRGGSGVFVVEREPLLGDGPSPFGNVVGYRFWGGDPDRPHILGWPRPILETPEGREYYKALNTLCCDLGHELDRLRTGSTDERRPEATIFLAEVTDDLYSQRNEVKQYLLQARLAVLPVEELYPLPLAAFRQEVDQDLRKCALFVQLLSNVPGRRPPGSQLSYNCIQYELATAAKIPVMQWRHPALDMRAVTDRTLCALLERDTVLAVGLEEFKAEVVKHARSKPSEPPAVEALVFVDAASNGDLQLAREVVCAALDKHGVGYALPLTKGTPQEIREDLEHNMLSCDILIVVYGCVPPTWVRRQLGMYRQLAPDRRRPAHVVALYEGPPPEKKVAIDFHLPRMRIINGRTGLPEEKLDEILDTLRASRECEPTPPPSATRTGVR